MNLYKYLYFIPILMVGYHVNGAEAGNQAMTEESNYSIENVSDITTQDLDRLISYLPALKFEAHQWTEEDFFNEGTPRNLQHELLRKWVRPYDWQARQSLAKAFQSKPELLQKASLPDIVKLLTLHVRKDRRTDGHLLSILKNGEMKHILNLLREIRIKEPVAASL